MNTRTCRVGVHGRNQEEFTVRTSDVIREAHIEVVKMMSQTKPEIFAAPSGRQPWYRDHHSAA